MLSTGNTKLGKIYNWSIPAIVTCPGRSTLCESLCYADRGMFKVSNVARKHAENLELTRQNSFVPDMVSFISGKKAVKTVRIHAAGDFYGAGYARKWHTIVRRCPDVTFYAYTRSWTKPRIYPALCDMAAEDNFQMWWSCDRDMPQPPYVDGVLSCYLSLNDEDFPDFDVDLVFRNADKTPMKRLDGNLVCPYEQGIKNSNGDKPKVTCQSCGICFKSARQQLVTLETAT